jgi:SAM-dependent MidA family methyltransferase
MATSGGRITFARYMELALYHPQHGYYLGPQQDYQTSAQAHTLFGALLARQLVQMWEVLGKPEPFQVVEIGAGCGQLAAAVCAHLSGKWPALPLQYTAIDVRPRPAGLPSGISWSQAGPELWPANSVTGCVLSNELIDAFPVHRVVTQGGDLLEAFVEPNPVASVDPEAVPFREVLDRPSTSELAEHYRWLGVTVPEGHSTEVNLAARRWIASVGQALTQGFILTIDYGAPVEELLARQPGTLMCYHRQQYNSQPYSRVGMQDITAHVDFTALVETGREEGLQFGGLAAQSDFLRNLGLAGYERGLERDRQAGRITAAQLYDRRPALRELTDPRGLGAFRVLVQHKGVGYPMLDGIDPTNISKRRLWAAPPAWEW